MPRFESLAPNRIPVRRTLAVLAALAALAIAPRAFAAGAPAADAPRSAQVAAVAALWQKLGLPQYVLPAAYSERLVLTADDKTFTLVRAIDGPRTRTEMNTEGKSMVMIELGDERGTMLNLVPDRKEAIKQSRAGMDEMMGGRMGRAEAAHAADSAQDAAAVPKDLKVDDLGTTR